MYVGFSYSDKEIFLEPISNQGATILQTVIKNSRFIDPSAKDPYGVVALQNSGTPAEQGGHSKKLGTGNIRVMQCRVFCGVNEQCDVFGEGRCGGNPCMLALHNT